MTLNEYVNSIKDKRIAVIGYGVSNAPLIKLLLCCGCKVTVCDRRSMADMGMEALELINKGATLKLGESYLEGLNHDIIFRTPGLMPFDEHLVKAQQQGSVVTSEMEVFFSLCPCRIIAITGSDGKTTTSTIIAELLKAAGYRVHLGGNIGHPLLCETPDIKSDDIAVLELSSFQLHSMRCKPDVAVITNISPNHLDKHLDYQDYIDSKSSIFIEQGAQDKLVLKLDDEQSEYYKAQAKSKLSWFSNTHIVEDGYCCIGEEIVRVRDGQHHAIMNKSLIKLPGEHNVLNYLAAFTAVDGLVSDDVCRQVAMEFGGVEHRLELVRELRGVKFINDSIGTSPTRTSAGLHALKTKPIVICGGYDKHIPFDTLGDELCQLARAAFLTGDTALKIRDAINGSDYYKQSNIEIFIVEDFDSCIKAAAEYAHEGDIVLFSPACASFDKFKNFAERGKHFKKLIMELK